MSAYYKTLGHPVLDADVAARVAVEKGAPCLKTLAKEFGADILNADCTLNRSLLAARAFTSPQSAQKLADITHPAIIKLLLDGVQKAEQSGAKICFVDGAVIIGGAFESYCDNFIVVIAPKEMAIARLIARDKLTKQDAQKRLEAQTPEHALIAKADYLLINDSTQEALCQKANATLQNLQANSRDEPMS